MICLEIRSRRDFVECRWKRCFLEVRSGTAQLYSLGRFYECPKERRETLGELGGPCSVKTLSPFFSSFLNFSFFQLFFLSLPEVCPISLIIPWQRSSHTEGIETHFKYWDTIECMWQCIWHTLFETVSENFGRVENYLVFISHENLHHWFHFIGP